MPKLPIVTRLGRAVACAALVLCPFIVSLAQSVAAVEVTVAAAHSVVDQLPKGRIVLESAPLRESGIRTAAEAARVARALGASAVGNASDYVHCDERKRPSDCRMSNVAALVAVGRPVIVGNTATVRVQMRSPGSFARIPIDEKEYLLSLRKSGRRWTVTRVFLDRVT